MVKSYIDLSGRRVIVTGTASGMGEATMRAYVRAGASVVGMDVQDEKGREAAEKAAAAGPGNVAYMHCDITDKGSVDAAFGAAVALLGGLDVLANAAGVLGRKASDELSVEDVTRQFSVNVMGTVLTNQAAFRAMRENGGQIINFGSGAGMNGYAGGAHYSASKGAVLSWSRSVAAEWGVHGITVNILVPAIWTPMYEERRAELSPEQLVQHDADYVRRIPMGGKLGDPDKDFAPVMLFLASEGARFITGDIFSVTGGSITSR